MSHLPTAVTAGIEVAVNRVLQLDEDIQPRLRTLQGKVIAIEMRGLDVSLYLIPEIDKLSVYGRFEGEPDTTLRGTPLALMRMGLAKHSGDVLFAGEVEISGDVELGQEFSEILEALDIDWEEHLSHFTGDLIANKLGNAVREILAWGQQTADTLSQDVTEYMQEESETVPNSDEAEGFLSQVDVLRTDVDRMDARVQRLEKNSQHSSQQHSQKNSQKNNNGETE